MGGHFKPESGGHFQRNLHAIAVGEIVVPNEFKPKTLSATATQALSPADELKKYKALLDDGTITQDEFNAKKKQILGL